MFLAWSLILTGVSYARHRRLQYVLLKFFYASVDNSLTLICRRRNAHIFQQVQIKRVCSSKCTLYKAPSAPSISQSDSLSSWDVNEEVIYRNENEEVLVKCGKIIIQKREWNFHSSITVFDQCEHIFFIVQVSDKEFISAEWHGLRQFIDDSARSIAQHHNNSLLFLYETSFNNFQNIVFNWSEKALFKDSAVVEELYSIDSESLLAAEKLPPSFPNSKSNNSIESHALPSSLQFTDSDKFSEKAQTSSQLDACNGMSLSRNSFQAILHPLPIQQPYSLLEALYFNELFGKYSHNEDSSTSNSLKLNAKICSSKPINKSDTCLPEHFDDYLSSSLSKVTKEKGENTSTKSSYGATFLVVTPDP
uniref:Uncharacterized protein n=1 Tax=Ditylenchus dipsaci TaxID=166011 RepID=A0A915DL95_9BILA